MESDGQCKILCEDMDLCGDLIQTLSDYLALEVGSYHSSRCKCCLFLFFCMFKDLGTSCDFPNEINKLEGLLSKAEELQSVRQRLSAEMADHSGMIRTLVVRAEDSRLMMDM